MSSGRGSGCETEGRAFALGAIFFWENFLEQGVGGKEGRYMGKGGSGLGIRESDRSWKWVACRERKKILEKFQEEGGARGERVPVGGQRKSRSGLCGGGEKISGKNFWKGRGCMTRAIFSGKKIGKGGMGNGSPLSDLDVPAPREGGYVGSPP